ncbi:ammonium transporter [Pseudoclavibacter sp. CFCC 13796]|uniref:ammonium transporter n=1 Tax=Pseudoclavibacter sp. CFCC 13796 TaxID=2615179 RepID=UPI001300D50E|nr:ammonium transporter [Pseudoclavibacter sp. CFCC 13796]KAB1660858.1 ammonium transporter [Pseudoclavibacter sp. CFCC 13796]
MDITSQVNTAWMLAATVAVTLMLPGLALYYGGLSRTKNILNTIMVVFGGFAVTALLWVLFGYGLTLGDSVSGAGLIGNPSGLFGLVDLIGAETPEGAVPGILIAGFQLIFAGLTVGIVGGAVEGRMKFSSWLVFAGLWATLVYFPVAHWVFAFDAADGSTTGGWIANKLGALDFAGGTAVHMNAGVAALVLAMFLGKRKGFPAVGRPGNLPIAILGGGLLLVGWYGFNGGSAGGINEAAGFSLTNTLVAACVGMLGWLIVERIFGGHATSLGAISGVLAGLVGITPAANSVSVMGAVVIGLIAGAIAYWALSLKAKLGYDDALDAVAIHMFPGIFGTVAIAFLADPATPAGAAGLFYGGGGELFAPQIIGVVSVFAYTFVVTALIAWALKATMGLRVTDAEENAGLDSSLHVETAYEKEDA